MHSSESEDNTGDFVIPTISVHQDNTGLNNSDDTLSRYASTDAGKLELLEYLRGQQSKALREVANILENSVAALRKEIEESFLEYVFELRRRHEEELRLWMPDEIFYSTRPRSSTAKAKRDTTAPQDELLHTEVADLGVSSAAVTSPRCLKSVSNKKASARTGVEFVHSWLLIQLQSLLTTTGGTVGAVYLREGGYITPVASLPWSIYRNKLSDAPPAADKTLPVSPLSAEKVVAQLPNLVACAEGSTIGTVVTSGVGVHLTNGTKTAARNQASGADRSKRTADSLLANQDNAEEVFGSGHPVTVSNKLGLGTKQEMMVYSTAGSQLPPCIHNAIILPFPDPTDPTKCIGCVIVANKRKITYADHISPPFPASKGENNTETDCQTAYAAEDVYAPFSHQDEHYTWAFCAAAEGVFKIYPYSLLQSHICDGKVDAGAKAKLKSRNNAVNRLNTALHQVSHLATMPWMIPQRAIARHGSSTRPTNSITPEAEYEHRNIPMARPKMLLIRACTSAEAYEARDLIGNSDMACPASPTGTASARHVVPLVDLNDEDVLESVAPYLRLLQEMWKTSLDSATLLRQQLSEARFEMCKKDETIGTLEGSLKASIIHINHMKKELQRLKQTPPPGLFDNSACQQGSDLQTENCDSLSTAATARHIREKVFPKLPRLSKKNS